LPHPRAASAERGRVWNPSPQASRPRFPCRL